MFIREVAKPNGSVSIRIVESVRRGGKVVQKTVRTLGQHKDPKEIQIIKTAAEALIVQLRDSRHPALPGLETEIHGTQERSNTKESVSSLHPKHLKERSRVNSGINAVFGHVYDQMKFDGIIVGTRKDDYWNSILRACVMARLAEPESKRRTTLNLARDFANDIPLQKIYRMMDHLSLNEEVLKSRLMASTLTLFNQQVDVMFFDVTTLYFESFDPDELRHSGFSKDCKFKETQVVLALVTNSEGHPLTYEIFPGNTYEGSTLVTAIESLKKRFSISQVILVADRAMFTESNLKMMEKNNVRYVVAAKLKALPKEIKREILNADFNAGVIGDELHWSKEFSYKNRRLLVGYSNRRAKKMVSIAKN